ncbi:MAG: DCC1-like thiol-disulfide oxidoreductase family protein [Bacteroidales bacterium]|nr:DCC1-like thiol-disulfide oxidoreductase family protein [Bacteroidales bacterium]
MSGTVLYDGECALCNSQVRFIRKRDRGNLFRFVSLQSEEGRSLLRSAGLPEDEVDTVVYVKEGKDLTRSSAVLGIVSDLGGGWRLLRILGIIPAGIRDFFYRLIARNRHRFSTSARHRISDKS